MNKLYIFLMSILSLSFVKADAVTDINQKIAGAFSGVSGSTVLTILGWVLFAVLMIGGGWWVSIYYKNKKVFSKSITAFEIVAGEWQPCIRDVSKVVKIGKGGFEILYFKKLKTHKIAYGGRVGKNTYYFFIMPDGYWYNGSLMANINTIDSKQGLIPITTTNPLMRGQYTALEKQIDSLHGNKKTFWDKYGTFVMSIAFILISGVLLWLMFKEYHQALGQLSNYHTQMGEILDKLSNLAGNIQNNQPTGGLIPVK